MALKPINDQLTINCGSLLASKSIVYDKYGIGNRVTALIMKTIYKILRT